MFTQTVEYALRAVVHLARIGGGPSTTDSIAQATKVPPGYLARVLRRLSKHGLLDAQRGVGGGFSLARPAGRISLWEVVQATESSFGRIENCPLGLTQHSGSLCSLHKILDDAIAQIEATLRVTTIQDVLTVPEPGKPLCSPEQTATLRLPSDS